MSQPELHKDRIALGIKQPWAELILRGIKTLEVRSRSTCIRGAIYLYTSKKIDIRDYATKAISTHQLDPDLLPCGLLVGSVDIVNSRPATSRDEAAACVPRQQLQNHFVWELAHPIRFPEPQPVRFLPYGVWFYPFQRRKQ